MPLYELLCLAKPKLSRKELAAMMNRIGSMVMDKGGVVTDVRSYGPQHLANDIRRPFERYAQAHIWQMNFMSAPATLVDLERQLSVDSNVLRWIKVPYK